MKTVLAFGDSNTWGTATVPRPDGRYGRDERWPGVLQQALGAGWHVVEEGLPGRTTIRPDPVDGEHMNGKAYLLPALRSHRPLDVVVILLGSNDLKARFDVSAQAIAAGAGELIEVVRKAEAGRGGGSPKILLVAPPSLLTEHGERPDFVAMFAGGHAKSLEFASVFQATAEAHGVAFLDAGAIIRSSAHDGLHLDPEAHEALGKAVAGIVSALA